MLDKTFKILTPFMFGYLVGYWERSYVWNKAWREKIRIHNNIIKDLIVDD